MSRQTRYRNRDERGATGRNGMVIGEGAAVFVIESEERVRSRGAMPLARLAGYGTSSDASDLLRPDASGAAAAMRFALADGGVSGDAVSSTKPVHGHALGASGALELVVTVCALRESFIPPTIHWLDRDPACDLDVVPNTGRPDQIRYALSNSFAFGGINASLLVARV